MIRYLCCKHVFLYCGKNINIERGVIFGSGRHIKIGNNSGIGINAIVPSNIEIGNNVMMGPNVYILSRNNKYDDINIPMIYQGMSEIKKVIIEDDVWVGRQVLILLGRKIRKGNIIGAGTVLCKEFEP